MHKTLLHNHRIQKISTAVASSAAAFATLLVRAPQVLAQIKFDDVNPLVLDKSPYAKDFSTPGGIISRALDFIFPIAGFILFVMIVWGGFEMVSGAANSKAKDAGRQRVTAAVIGFILLFVAYWIIQITEVIFGVTIF